MPTVVTGIATNVLGNGKNGQTSGYFNGSISDMGVATTTYVNADYGLTATYGYTTTNIVVSSEGDFTIPFSATTIFGQPYHFRVNTINGTTVVHGSDQTFVAKASGQVPSSIILISILSFILAMGVVFLALRFTRRGNWLTVLLALAAGLVMFVLAQALFQLFL